MSLSTDDLDYVRRFVCRRAAIVLDEKDYLIEARLHALAGREGFESAASLVRTARQPRGNLLTDKIVDALTTNETLFFRDVHPFQALRERIVPEIAERNAASRSLRLWCAACSTGQEPYSIAMLLRAHFPQLDGWKIRILATDISASVLRRAAEGRYNQTEINRGLPAAMMVRFFEQRTKYWEIAPEIRRMVVFQPRNLIEPWPEESPFDLIFARNVMIYFDVAARATLLGRLALRLAPEGWLLMGAGESAIGISDAFKPVAVGKTVFFRKK